jgi:hypothetical protein
MKKMSQPLCVEGITTTRQQLQVKMGTLDRFIEPLVDQDRIDILGNERFVTQSL